MNNTEITPELVKELYCKYNNHSHFLSCFGTKKFHLQNQSTLVKMYNFLIRKVK